MAFPKAKDELDFGMGTVPNTTVSGAMCINDMEVCTYDESHVLAGGKYDAHVKNCRARHLGSKLEDDDVMKICPYNPTHHVHQSVMDKHIEICDAYYKYSMDHQELPLSMQKKIDRYEIKGPISNHDQYLNELDGESDWGDDDEENEDLGDDDQVKISGVSIVDVNGFLVFPKTKGEFKAVQKELLEVLVQDRLRDMEGEDFKPYRSVYDGGHFLLRDLSTLPSTSDKDKMAGLAKFIDDSERKSKLAALMRKYKLKDRIGSSNEKAQA